jgi:hypothetical protein
MIFRRGQRVNAATKKGHPHRRPKVDDPEVRRRRVGSRALRRAARRAEPRKLSAWGVRVYTDKRTGKMVRAVLLGRTVNTVTGPKLVPIYESRQVVRGAKFAAWLDAEFAEKARERRRR